MPSSGLRGYNMNVVPTHHKQIWGYQDDLLLISGEASLITRALGRVDRET